VPQCWERMLEKRLPRGKGDEAFALELF